MKYLLICIACIPFYSFAQRDSISIYKKFENWSFREVAILSYSQTEQAGEALDDKLRFAPVFNLGHEFHFNLTTNLGIYTGLGIRNVGYIDRPVYYEPGATSGTELKMKHRVYSLILPLALKLGNIPKHSYVSLGAEMNLFLNYKEKVWLNGSKTKKSEWFSNRTELLNLSLFVQFVSKKHYLKLILYPNNFLKESNTTFAGDLYIPNYPSKSDNLIMITCGFLFDEFKLPFKSKGRTFTLRYNLVK